MMHKALKDRLAADHLQVFGTAHAHIALIGPREPGFWTHFTASPEWADGTPDPMDRWSTRVLTAIAAEFGARARFPFAPDDAPFLSWAMNSDAAWQSPVGMLVQADAGLMVSYRGALEFDAPLPRARHANPCTSCAQPCTTACPIGALSQKGYDVPACKAWIASDEGADCRTNGCLVRRACPVSQTYARQPAQSAYHMERFLG